MKKIIIISLLFLTSYTHDEDYICSCKEYIRTASKQCTALIEIHSNINNLVFSDFINNLMEDTLFLHHNLMDVEIQNLKDVYFPNLSNENQYVSSPIIGYAKAKDTTKINRLFNTYLKENKDLIEFKVRFLWSQKSKDIFGDGINYYSFYGLNKLQNSGITKYQVDDARISKHPNHPNYGVEIYFNNEGSDAFSQYTKEHTGKFISIISYNKVMSAPIIIREVTGGQMFIDGDFTKNEAGLLINRLSCFNYSQRIGQRKFNRKIQNCK